VNISWSAPTIMFFLISLFVLGCSVMMLNFRKVVYMALAIGGTFIGCSGIYIMLGAEFVGIAQVMIYAGAITILILFAIMLTNHEAVEPETKWNARNVASALGCFLLGVTLLLVIRSQTWPQTDLGTDLNGGKSNAVAIGVTMLQQYTVPFEIISLVLIVALVGAVVIAQNRKEGDE
jgi:NADH-quinone oxidoreductase subunit J